MENIGLIIASVTAIYGINAWRREFRGKKEYELAEETLMLFYDCRDRLRAIRSPYSRTTEGSSRKIDLREKPEETELLNRAFIVFERYEHYQEAFTKLFALRYRFMALFAREAVEPIEDLRRALNEVFTSAEILPWYWQRQGRYHMTDDDLNRYLKEVRAHESVFWGTFSEKDEFNNRVEEFVSRMEETCSRIIRPTPFWRRIRSRGKTDVKDKNKQETEKQSR